MTQPAPQPQVPKAPWKSLTTYATILLGALSGAQAVGALPEGTTGAVSGVATAILTLLSLFGRARAQGPLTLN